MLEMTKRCKEKRNKRTFYEEKFLKILRNKDIRFRSQVQIGYYIVDFIILDTGIVVEIDGEQHDQNIDYDNKRTAFIKRYGFRVIRIKNKDIDNFDIDILKPTEQFDRHKIKKLCLDSKKDVNDILKKINNKDNEPEKIIEKPKEKMIKEGQLCRKCGTPIIRKYHKENKKIKEGRKYYYKSFLYCEGCDTQYFEESERVYIDKSP